MLLQSAVALAVFLLASLVLLWRLDALLRRGWAGTFLGSLIMPYCSGLGNIVFVLLVVRNPDLDGMEVFTNAIVNNLTNLSLLLGLPALLGWLILRPAGKAHRSAAKRPTRAITEFKVTRLELLFSILAALFFLAVVWVLGRDGTLDATDGFVLVSVFFFWQAFHAYEVWKTRLREQAPSSPAFFLDLALILIASGFILVSVDALVDSISSAGPQWFGEQTTGWLTGFIMVVPNAILALYYGWKRRADVVYASQIADGHICIPFCLGLAALFGAIQLDLAVFEPLMLTAGGLLAFHALALVFLGGLPRWLGIVPVAAFAGIVALGLW